MADFNFDFNDDLRPEGLTDVIGNWGATGGKWYSTNTGTGPKAVTVIETGESDGTLSCIMNNGGASTGFIGLVFRYVDVNNFLLASVNAAGNDVATVRIMSYTGTWNTLFSVSMTGFWRSNDIAISVNYQAENITVTVDGTVYLTETVGSYLTATQVGFRSDSTTSKYFDDFVFNGIAAADLTIDNYKFKQHVAGSATVPITGALVGSPTALEYRVDGGAWTTGLTAPTTGNYSFDVVLSEGQHVVDVRFADNAAVTATAAHISVVDVIVGAGQSDNSGRGDTVQSYIRGTGDKRHLLLNNGNGYSELSDPWDSNIGQVEASMDDAGAAGSFILRMGHHLMAYYDKPFGFVPANKGATSINVWAKGGALYTALTNRINLAGGCDCIVWHQGQSDQDQSTATHEALLTTLCNDFITDFGCKVIIVQLHELTADRNATPNAQNIRQAHQNVAAALADVYITVDNIDVTDSFDGTHLTSNAALDTVGERTALAYRSIYNTNPVANAGITRNVDAGVNVVLDATGSTDADGDTLYYTWVKLSGPAISLLNATTATPSFTAPVSGSVSVFVFEVTVSDGILSDTASVTINVSAAAASTLNITVSGAPNGTYKTIITNPVDDSIVFVGGLVYTSGAATTGALAITAGTSLTGYVIDNELTHVNGAVITGVTV